MSKTKTKKQSKNKSPAARKVIARIEAAAPAEREIKNTKQFTTRMKELFNYTLEQLDRIALAKDTPVSDLIILRMLYDMRELGNMGVMMFYLDCIFGNARAITGGLDDDEVGGRIVQVFELPANGAEKPDGE